MALNLRSLLRRWSLAAGGLTFLGIAILTLIFPKQVAWAYAYSLPSGDAFIEFGAIFVGFWLGLAVLLLTAAKRLDNVLLGNLGALAILLQALGRPVGLWLLCPRLLESCEASPRFVLAFVLELAISLTALATRPRTA